MLSHHIRFFLKEVESANASQFIDGRRHWLPSGLSNPREHFIVMHTVTTRVVSRNIKKKKIARAHCISVDTGGCDPPFLFVCLARKEISTVTIFAPEYRGSGGRRINTEFFFQKKKKNGCQ